MTRPAQRSFGRRGLLLLLAVACLAPTPGDIGGCGEPARELDASAFFEAKRALDCQACTNCGLGTERCAVACSGETAAESFPEGCFPLVHDGAVCLRALRYSSCEEYAAFVADVAATVPTECNFCPEDP